MSSLHQKYFHTFPTKNILLFVGLCSLILLSSAQQIISSKGFELGPKNQYFNEEWTYNIGSDQSTAKHIELFPNGDLFVSGKIYENSSFPNYIARFSEEGNLIWMRFLSEFTVVFNPTEFILSPNGSQILALAYWYNGTDYNPYIISFDALTGDLLDYFILPSSGNMIGTGAMVFHDSDNARLFLAFVPMYYSNYYSPICLEFNVNSKEIIWSKQINLVGDDFYVRGITYSSTNNRLFIGIFNVDEEFLTSTYISRIFEIEPSSSGVFTYHMLYFDGSNPFFFTKCVFKDDLIYVIGKNITSSAEMDYQFIQVMTYDFTVRTLLQFSLSDKGYSFSSLIISEDGQYLYLGGNDYTHALAQEDVYFACLYVALYKYNTETNSYDLLGTEIYGRSGKSNGMYEMCLVDQSIYFVGYSSSNIAGQSVGIFVKTSDLLNQYSREEEPVDGIGNYFQPFTELNNYVAFGIVAIGGVLLGAIVFRRKKSSK